MTIAKAFYAYPSEPSDIGEIIEAALNRPVVEHANIDITSWRQADIAGVFIRDEVLKSIEASDILIADISILNFNVMYEIGYAIGQSKRLILTKLNGLKENCPTLSEVGLLDTIGFSLYQNSSELSRILTDEVYLKNIDIHTPIATHQPVYYILPKYKPDWIGKITARIKRSGYLFRSFDADETPRLSSHEAIQGVGASFAVVVPLLGNMATGAAIHNMRAAFVAGLAHGMGKATSILQKDENDPIPLDYRDFATYVSHPNVITESIAELARAVAKCFQQGADEVTDFNPSYLQSLDLGSSSAENEMRTLQDYYLRTEEYMKSLRGEAHIVVGRKGTGKSAIFLQIRDEERRKINNVVLDLKPEGYKLIKFKEQILQFLSDGTFKHTIVAFWEYVLLHEICLKILEVDKQNHLRNSDLIEPYTRLRDLYYSGPYSEVEGDFSERMSGLMTRIGSEYQSKYPQTKSVTLSSPEVTELLHIKDLSTLKKEISSYLSHKDTLWLLFDNVDKGWPTSGLTQQDLVIIRCLIDATRKLENQLQKKHVRVNSIIFLRNDVYELLVSATSDRGKEANVQLDWTEPSLLRQMLRLRLIKNQATDNIDFLKAWHKVCTPHYKGEESSQFLIDRSLMRPRFLLNLLSQCKGYAVNLNHQIIEESDIERGLDLYSTDLLTEVSYELRDIDPNAEDLLYAFIESKSILDEKQIGKMMTDFKVIETSTDKIFHLLLWYGFLGLRLPTGEVKYIYNVNYKIQVIEALRKKHGANMLYQINPAFWPALLIDSELQRGLELF